jgi:hypothetical protein
MSLFFYGYILPWTVVARHALPAPQEKSIVCACDWRD